MDFIIRKTLGFNKRDDKIALSQINLATGIVKPSIIRAIKQLESMNLIYKNAKEIPSYRFNKDFSTWKPLAKKQHVSENVNHGLQKSKSSLAKTQMIVSENATHKRNFTKETITKETLQKKDGIPYQDIINYLNQKTGKRFTLKPKATIGHINARWSEGYSLEDFKTVIDNKCTSWLLDPKMAEYLRPDTLFGPKFEAYLNEIRHPLVGAFSETTRRNIELLRDLEAAGMSNENTFKEYMTALSEIHNKKLSALLNSRQSGKP